MINIEVHTRHLGTNVLNLFFFYIVNKYEVLQLKCCFFNGDFVRLEPGKWISRPFSCSCWMSLSDCVPYFCRMSPAAVVSKLNDGCKTLPQTCVSFTEAISALLKGTAAVSLSMWRPNAERQFGGNIDYPHVGPFDWRLYLSTVTRPEWPVLR